MSMITGVGDEVVEVACALLVASVAALAWWSTAARPDRFRTVIVMERTARATPHHLTLMGRNISNIRRHLLRGSATAAPAGTLPPDPPPSGENQDGESSSVTPGEAEAAPPGAEPVRVMASEVGGVGEGAGEAELAGSEQAQEMDRIVDAMDADINVLRHRRLNFFTRTNGETPSETVRSPDTHSIKTDQPCDTSDDGNRDKPVPNNGETDTNASEDAAETSRRPEAMVESKDCPVGDAGSSEDAHKVNIRLKYLNDTFREVDGSLQELLKDFKWRHFASELSGDCRVLLIFNGHVLSDDTNTLRACGLYHNCVVHCLVHPPRQRGAGPAGGEVVPSLLEAAGVAGVAGGAAPGLEAEGVAAPAAEPRAWDLENILMTLVSIILTIIWFFRCEYANIFTASASGALFALTVFYTVAIFGLYFSDTFHFTERRQRVNEHAGAHNLPYA